MSLGVGRNGALVVCSRIRCSQIALNAVSVLWPSSSCTFGLPPSSMRQASVDSCAVDWAHSSGLSECGCILELSGHGRAHSSSIRSRPTCRIGMERCRYCACRARPSRSSPRRSLMRAMPMTRRRPPRSSPSRSCASRPIRSASPCIRGGASGSPPGSAVISASGRPPRQRSPHSLPLRRSRPDLR